MAFSFLRGNSSAPAAPQNPPQNQLNPAQGQQGQQTQQTFQGQQVQQPQSHQFPGQQQGQNKQMDGGPSGNDPTKSPIEAMQGIWDTDATDNVDDVSKLFNIEPAKVMEAVRQNNYTQGIDKTLIQKALSGGEDAADALLQVINQAVQTGAAQSHVMAANIAQHGISAASKHLLGRHVPDLVRRHTTREQVRASNPLYQDPLFKPVVEEIHNRVVTKYPDASPAEVAAMTDTYFKQMLQKKFPGVDFDAQQKQTAQRSQQQADESWDDWFIEGEASR